MKKAFGVLASLLLGLALAACSRDLPTTANGTEVATLDRDASGDSRHRSKASVFRAAGDITATLNAFRDALGTLNANTPGSQAGGRREINWDAVPAQFTNTNDFPADFFNQPATGRARGVEFATRGTGFRTSDNNFTDLNPAFATEFVFFSPVRTFAPVDSRRMTVDFFVPGSDVAATSTGFGVVFSDVDHGGSASIRLFDDEGRSLGRYSAPRAPGGVSFVGVMFPSRVVARVEIVSGEAAVSPDARDVGNRSSDEDDDDDLVDRGPQAAGAKHDRKGDDDDDRPRRSDLVIMDDFVYGEPIAASGTSAPVVLGPGGVRPGIIR